MRYGTVLFDADDTLLDFKRSEREAAASTLESFGIRADDEALALYSEINAGLWRLHERGEITKSALRTRRFELLCAKLGVGADSAGMADEYIRILGTKAYLMPGAEATLERLLGRCRMYIITNGFESIQKSRLSASGLERFMRGVFISERVGFEKPSARFFGAVEAAIPGFDAGDTLVVGDSLTSDIAGGIGAGLDVCWFNPGGKSAPEGMKINYIIGDLIRLPEIIEGC